MIKRIFLILLIVMLSATADAAFSSGWKPSTGASSGWTLDGSTTTETPLDVVIGGELTVEGTGDTEIAGNVIVDGTIQASAANILGADEVMSFSDGNSIDGNKTPGYITIDDLMVTSSDTTLGNAFRVQNSALSTKFTVLSNGNVGLGTTVPHAELMISNDTTIPSLLIKAVTGTGQTPCVYLQRGAFQTDILADMSICDSAGTLVLKSIASSLATPMATFAITGNELNSELIVGGISADGTGKVVCIKSDTKLGTCGAGTITTDGCTCN